MEKRTILIRTKSREYIVQEGEPVIITWKSKNKTRQGLNTAVGWLMWGDRPHTVTLVHSCFQTWDKLEQEYPSKWTIWHSQILEIRPLATAAGR